MTQARTSRSNREKYLQDQGEERVWIITSCGNIDSEDSMIPCLSSALVCVKSNTCDPHPLSCCNVSVLMVNIADLVSIVSGAMSIL